MASTVFLKATKTKDLKERLIINTDYTVFYVFQLRQRNLENAIKYYHFSNECNNMEIWMTNKVR